MGSTRNRLAVALLLTAVPAYRLTAQCPDGSPPPCRATSSVGGRVQALALNDNVWLVLPFENTARAADAELIRQASVNLLYQNLSRWSEISVISDDRVADLVRQVDARDRGAVGLTSGRDLARRVGAGRLVLGDYLAIGGQARLAATVYDVRSGRAVRAVREQLGAYASSHALDSLTASFDRLAQSLLDLRAPARVRQGLGTSSLEAFRFFQAGMAMYRAGRLDSARSRFARALAYDSNYAWAHFRLYWVSASMGLPFASYRQHLDAAARLAADLPPREQALISGWIALPRSQTEVICARADELLRADSSDAEAWHFRGHCLAANARVVRDPADSSRFVLRPGTQTAIDAWERGLSLDPSHGETFSDLVNVLRVRAFGACIERQSPCPEPLRLGGVLLGTGDSVVEDLRRASEIVSRPDLTRPALASYRDRLDRAQAAAVRFVAANPESHQGHALAASVMLHRGSLAGAARELEAAARTAHSPGQRRLVNRERLELLLRLDRPDSAALLLDSMSADSVDRAALTYYHATFGRFAWDAPPAGDSARRDRAAWLPILAGVFPADFDRIEDGYAASLPPASRSAALELSTLVGFRWRGAGPAIDTAARHPVRRAQAFLSRGDTARARALLIEIDAELATRPGFTIDDGAWLLAAETFLALGDTARALVRLSDWAQRWSTFSHSLGIILDQTVTTASVRLAGRSWLLFGDLAQRTGRAADARRAYRMVVGLWERGEPPVQPLVARSRAALTQLEGR